MLPLEKVIQSNLAKFSGNQDLKYDGAPFCYICAKRCESASRYSVGEVDSFLILQFNRLTSSEGSVSKNLSPASVIQIVIISSEVDEDVLCWKKVQ